MAQTQGKIFGAASVLLLAATQLGHLVSNSWAGSTDMVDVTDKDSPSYFKEHLPAWKDGTLEGTIWVRYDMEVDRDGWDDLWTAWNNRTALAYLDGTNNVGDSQLAGNCYITNLSKEAVHDGYIQATISLQSTGAITNAIAA